MTVPSLFQSQIFLTGEYFHRNSKLKPPEKRTYSIIIENQIYELSPEETLLLSNSAFQSNSTHGQPFIIQIPSSHVLRSFPAQLKKSIKSLLSLVKNQIQIEISFQEKEAFTFLGKELDNRSLQQVCRLVSPSQNQFFCLSSERFREISQSQLQMLQNFRIIINEQVFCCNSIFASLLSKNIFESILFNSDLNEIQWNDPQLDQILVSLFYLLKGLPFPAFQFEPYLLLKAFILIGFHPSEIEIGNPSSFEEAVVFLSHLSCFDFPD
jgi:hypothetical protein